jgi:hypothetical protein
LLPALLTALGVTLLVAGLLTYTHPVTAETADLATPAPTDGPALETPFPRITLPPLGSAAPSAKPSIPADRHATRVRVAALKIDLPVIAPGKPDEYPLCNVAMWLGVLGQPGEGRATYIYAHARDGMFLPLLNASKVKNGKRLLGMIVEVWTSDDQKFLYEITEVQRHQRTLDEALGAKEEQLWLQTSEGPAVAKGQTPHPKLQILALPLSQEASDHKSAHPKAKPVVCG